MTERKQWVYIAIVCIGAIAGANIAVDLDQTLLKRIIATALLLVLVVWLKPKAVKLPKIAFRVPKIIILITAFLIGIYYAIVGSGGGFLLTFFFLFTTGKGLKDVLIYRLGTGLIAILLIAPIYI